MNKSLNLVCLAIGLTIGVFAMPAQASGYIAGSVQYNSTTNYASGGNYNRPVVVRHYPNGRVEVVHVPVVHVYPNGVSLVHQNGGNRTYSTGYGGAATCYVECWHNGVNPNRRSGTQWSVGIGVHSNW
jgi:hypothetical protein